jgi:hypothetical protein
MECLGGIHDVVNRLVVILAFAMRELIVQFVCTRVFFYLEACIG